MENEAEGRGEPGNNIECKTRIKKRRRKTKGEKKERKSQRKEYEGWKKDVVKGNTGIVSSFVTSTSTPSSFLLLSKLNSNSKTNEKFQL